MRIGESVGRWVGESGEKGKGVMEKVKSFSELEVYKSAFRIQQHIYSLSKRWPKVEDYSLTDQVRRSSRSIGASIAEAWGKRPYPAHFLSKPTDADSELQETLHWLETARACQYLTTDEHAELIQLLAITGKLLGAMIARYESFCY